MKMLEKMSRTTVHILLLDAGGVDWVSAGVR